MLMRALLLVFLVITTGLTFGQDETVIKKQAEKAILKWANEHFEYYDAPSFENFHLSPSPDYYAMSILREEFVTFKEEIVYNFKEGKSDRSEQEVIDDTTNIQKKIEELDVMLNTIDPKFDHIEYFMWANVRTNNGLTVYYQHQFKLDENYNVVSFRESSAVGKPDDVEIIFKD